VVKNKGSTLAVDPVAATSTESPAAEPCLGEQSTNDLATDAALQALLLDDSIVTGKPRSLFES
jgi:hypothetical protein